MDIDRDTLARLAISLLENEDGIEEKSYDMLYGILQDAGLEAILNRVDSVNGKFFLYDEDVQNLKEILVL